jgi:hypothetical protein
LTNLKDLNLIPTTELELLCSVSPKALRAIAKAADVSELLDDAAEGRSSQSGNSDETVFHDCREEPDAGDDGDENAEQYFLKSPPELFPVVSSSLRVPQPSKALRDAYLESYLQRPLPELPVEDPSRLSRRSSAASAISATLSITPSLLQYVDEDSLNPDEIEVGVAQLVQLSRSQSTIGFIADEEPDPADYSISDYETSPKSPGDSFSGNKLSPSRYLPMTGSGLERGIASFPSPKQSMVSKGLMSRQSLPSDFHSQGNPSRFESTGSGESGQVGAPSPSPARVKNAKIAARRESSPQTTKGSGRSLFAGLRKKKISGSPIKLAGIFGHDVPKPGDGGNIVQRAMGSWI